MSLRTTCLALLPLLLATAADGQGEVTKPQSQKELFGLDRIWDVHIDVPYNGWTSMHPESKRKIDYGAGFPYAKARVRIAGHDELTVGLRFKGNSTYWKMPRKNLKRPFKLDFDRHKKGQTFLGLKKLNLNNNYYDQTQLREALSCTAYREGSVPAARTAFARVFELVAKRRGGVE